MQGLNLSRIFYKSLFYCYLQKRLLLETGFGNPASVEGGHVVVPRGKNAFRAQPPESEIASSENPVAKT
jgi:hypothetical protein